jgi:hypothetical protein
LDVAIGDLVELRDKFQGPPETTAHIGWLRMRSDDQAQGVADFQSYLKAQPDGPLATWAQQWVTWAEKQPQLQN